MDSFDKHARLADGLVAGLAEQFPGADAPALCEPHRKPNVRASGKRLPKYIRDAKVVAIDGKSAAPGIEQPEYAQIAPGVYRAYSISARIYLDPGYHRWVCLIRWNVFSSGLDSVIARVPLWFALGGREKPRAGLRSKYFSEWMRANGAPPKRRDQMSPKVFCKRMARVEIGNTDLAKKGPVSYSVVRSILKWETGVLESHSIM